MSVKDIVLSMSFCKIVVLIACKVRMLCWFFFAKKNLSNGLQNLLFLSILICVAKVLFFFGPMRYVMLK